MSSQKHPMIITLKSIGAFLFGTVVMIWIILPAPLLLHYWFAKGYISMLERVGKYDKQQAEYFFNGANNRHLLDICESVDGEIKVLWKEDCK